MSTRLGLGAALLLAAAGCDFDAALKAYRGNASAQDAGHADAGSVDAGGQDAGTLDAGGEDAGAADAGAGDAGPGDAGTDGGSGDAGADGGPSDGGRPDGGADAGPGDAGAALLASCATRGGPALAQLRAMVDGGATSALPVTVERVMVTAFKRNAASLEAEGFFVQCSPAGPALFLNAPDSGALFGDAGWLAANDAGLAVGDVVTLTVGALLGTRVVTGVLAAPPIVLGTASPSLLTVDVSDVDVARELDQWESRLVSFSGPVVRVAGAGAGYTAAGVLTDGGFRADGGAQLEVRIPSALAQPLELNTTCTARVTAAPLWRFNATPQASPLTPEQLQGTRCPGPRLISAVSTGSTAVSVRFDRSIAAATVTAAAFSISPALAVTSASVTTPTLLEVRTAVQGQQPYTIAPTAALTDLAGQSAQDAGATFSGFNGSCPPPVLINQIYPNSTNAAGDAGYSHDFVELRNTTNMPMSLSGWTLRYGSSLATSLGTVVPLTGTIPARGFYLFRLQAAAGAGGVPLPTPDVDQQGLLPGSAGGKFALMRSNVALPLLTAGPDAGCLDVLAHPDIVDFVGYGTANCFEGAAPAPISVGATQWLTRTGCSETNENALDFTHTSTPARNSASAPSSCVCP